MWDGAFSCPLCQQTIEQVVCDDCYNRLLLAMNPVTEGLQTTWFDGDSDMFRAIIDGLYQNQIWPCVLVAHLLYQFRVVDRHFRFAVYDQDDSIKQGAGGLVNCLNYLWNNNSDDQVYVCWQRPDVRPRRLNWVIFK